jgi:metal transporter CNNM
MTPIRDVVMLSSDTILDHSTMNAMYSDNCFLFAEAHSHLFSLTSGYSRFPVHKPGNSLAFEGLLLIKKLLMYDPTRGLPVSHFPLSILPEALPSINCFQALDYFQTGRAHLLLISRTPGSPGGGIGVITLEDVIEEMISEEIVDETDQYEDNQSKRHAKRMINTTTMRDIVELERSIFPQTSTQVTSMNIEVVPLLPGSSQQDYPQAYRYVYNSMGESEH